MKKYLLSVFTIAIGLVLSSWGSVGHETVAKIAENHLTSKTRAAVEDLLSGQSMAKVSTYADQTKTPATAPCILLTCRVV